MGWTVAAAWLALLCIQYSQANPEARRLYDDLLTNYNRLIRPVENNTDRLLIKMGLRLSQLIEVNLRNQIMTTSVWVEQEWNDYKLRWNPDEYGGVDYLHVPSEHIWLPDIVLYNNADGQYEVTIMTKAIVHYTGKVVWKPPAIYKSFCEIDLEYFPFDEQTCGMKFGSWTYDGYKVDLQHISQDVQEISSENIEMGMDLQDFYLSVEWDVMKVPAKRRSQFYPCCEEPYLDIMFNLTLRRKTLFYTVNLIIPCIGLSFLCVLVFYLPADSGEKVSLCISILVSLTVFFLLLAEIIPPTSLTVPLLGKYLLFTMILVTLSVVVTIIVLNVNFRSPVTHRMKPWVSTLFIDILPRVLFIRRPDKEPEPEDEPPLTLILGGNDYVGRPTSDIKFNPCDFAIPPMELLQYPTPFSHDEAHYNELDDDLYGVGNAPFCGVVVEDGEGNSSPVFETGRVKPLEKAVEDAKFIAQHVKNKDRFDKVTEDWKYIAMVLDRLFLWIFLLACILGTVFIILTAPSLYDTTMPIDKMYSKIYKKKLLRELMLG